MCEPGCAKNETLIFKGMRSQPRAIPMITDSASVHPSTINRHNTPPITQAPFHPSAVLAVGGRSSARIFAKERWNDTGLYLESGTYEQTATGQWLDATTNGVDGGKFHLGNVADLVGSVLGQIEKGCQAIRGNKQADFKFTRRVEDAPWFALMGVVANEPGVKTDGTPLPHQPFVIGTGPTPLKVEKAGYLYCFANDAWDFYFNNSGSVELTVARKS